MGYQATAIATMALVAPAFAAPQDSQISIPQEVLDSVNALFPERNNSNASYLEEANSPNLVFIGAGSVELTFIWEGAGYRNSLGYFTYRTESNGSITILSSNLVMPNASLPNAGTAASGDTYFLRDEFGSVRVFQPGERVGFFLVADGWRTEPLIQNWNPSAVVIPTNDPVQNRFIGRGCYTSICELNPEMRMGAPERACHLAMVQTPGVTGIHGGESFYLCGFEDLNRRQGSDDDFNDLLFTVRANPAVAAVADVGITTSPELDDDNDGVPSLEDAFPFDPDRAFIHRYPSSGSHTLAFEDRYPLLGDADYNDAVLAYDYQWITNAAGRVVELQGTFALIGRGAGFNHEFGVHLPALPITTEGTLQIERFLSDAAGTHQVPAATQLSELVGSDRRRIKVFTSTRQALPKVTHEFATNTTTLDVERKAALSRFLLTFDTPLAAAQVGRPPFDPYLASFLDADVVDIHLPGNPGFFDRPADLPLESGPQSFLDDNGYPWALELPSDWRWPLEHEEIWRAYPNFSAWVTSGGNGARAWFNTPESTATLISRPATDYTRDEGFTVRRTVP